MAIHSQLPNDRGLELWVKWSRKDPEFADDWDAGNPCEQAWKSFRPGKIGLGSLIWEADKVDPGRTRSGVQQADPYGSREEAGSGIPGRRSFF